jgi:Zn-dependent M16 (insulinase) family peptidase
MSLASSTAFTQQWRTCYSFYTSAGLDVFYDEFERRLDALLHPDYTDEEIRREVRNFGITEHPADKTLGLEEKGSVYNEMVSSSDQPGRRLYRNASRLIYGADHPLQFDSGGSPEALRDFTPAHIRSFHAAHYFLANMGAIVSVPRDVPLASALQRVDALLNRVEPRRPPKAVMTEKTLPAPRPGPAGEIRFVEYPHRNDQQPGAVYLVWPANREMDVTERTLLGLFLDAFAGDPTTNLYKRLIDSTTREIAFGAQGVFGWLNSDQGLPMIVGFSDVPVARMNPQDLADLRTRVLDEFSRVARWTADTADLRDFNDRVRSRVIEMRRDLAKFVNSPPGFGLRSTGAGWLSQIDDLQRQGGFRRSLTMKPLLASIDALLARPGNIWTARIASWTLESTSPWVLAAKPDTTLAGRQQQERVARVAAEVARLRTQYGVSTDQAALDRYRAEYAAASKVIEDAAVPVTPPKFVANPPLTLDDHLQFETSQLAGGVPMVSSTFSSMAGATTGLSLRLDGVPVDRLLYLSALPALLTRVGVIENGRPVSFEAMSERLRREILSLTADFTTNARTERVDLTMRGSGNDATEARRAIEWMRLALFHPDWRPENLPRIRDVLDQMLNGLRRTPQTAEENWVRPVATAYWRQHNPLLLTATSFMTQTHQIHRLRWMLKAGTPAERSATRTALDELAGVKGTRTELKAALAALLTNQNPVLVDAAKDLDATLVDLPDASLAMDWVRLCREMADDVAVGPEQALATLDRVRQDIVKTANARLFLVASAATTQALASPLGALVGDLDTAPVVRVRYGTEKLVDARLRERDGSAARPRYVGLLNPNSQSGVFINSAPAAAMEDTDRDQILDYLASIVYAGPGSHTIFSRTIGAGLAYSNGLNASPLLGRVTYYAERTPDLPQTLRFVVDQLKGATLDRALAEYAIAQAFTGTRSANSYESRGEAMAHNLADGLTPAIVRRFRTQVLQLRTLGPALVDELSRRKHTLPARVLPGLGSSTSSTPDTVIFVIGPEKQFASWEQYLTSVEGQTATVFRLYPRDFWLPAADGP